MLLAPLIPIRAMAPAAVPGSVRACDAAAPAMWMLALTFGVRG